VNAEIEDEIEFKIKTTFEGDTTHLSALVTISITCASNYTISQETFTNPQMINFEDPSVGFVLPAY
jgi:hypothetical protein